MTQALGIEVEGVTYKREAVAAHANNLASKVKAGLENSLKVRVRKQIRHISPAAGWRIY